MDELRPGVVVASRYRLEHELGRGGMGAVWAAEHTVTRRRVALKFLVPSAGPPREMRRRLIREARAAALAQHPNVVEIYDVFDLDHDTPVLVMELLAGETMGAFFAREPGRSVATVVSLMLPVVSAVGTAHAGGVIHRDLKPDNIFLAQVQGRMVIRVLDFGIAKVAPSSDVGTSAITMPGYMLGTPCYMAPEQLYGDPDVDCRADIWSIGAILYEGFAGVRPIAGLTRAEVFKRYFTPIAPITDLVPSLSADLAALVMDAFAPAPEDRPKDLVEVFEVLRAHADHDAPRFGPPVVVRVERPHVAYEVPTPDRAAPASAMMPAVVRQVARDAVELELGAAALRLRWIPPGDFVMGSSPDDPLHRADELPSHRVVLRRGLWLAEAPTTQAQWRAVMGTDPSRFRGDARPVERVSWDDCHLFLREVVTRFGVWLRLPTEAEWEYACRGDECGWCAANSDGETHAVGQLRPNAFGLHDMLGNVWEWCHDIYGPYIDAPCEDPQGAVDGHVRVIRGGSWVNVARLCRPATRRWRGPAMRFDFVGFRVAADAAALGIPGVER